MNNYPIWWDSAITIYNKYRDVQTDITTWTRTEVEGCFWKMVGTQVIIGETTLDTKSIVCRIPKDSRFLEKKDWINLSAYERGNYFTLAPGDIIVKGECEDIIDEYTKGHRSTDLLSKYREYQACIEITEYSNNTGVGRNDEHYWVRGK